MAENFAYQTGFNQGNKSLAYFNAFQGVLASCYQSGYQAGRKLLSWNMGAGKRFRDEINDHIGYSLSK